jgi:putative Holliday junction resolvase
LRVLAIDYGEVRVGCAVSDPSGTLATPLPAVSPPDLDLLAELCREKEVELVVVGLPRSLSGEEGPQAEATRAFISSLASVVDIPIETWDERFTTRMAAATRRQARTRADEDSIAAAHLLDSFLSSRQGPGDGDGQ